MFEHRVSNFQESRVQPESASDASSSDSDSDISVTDEQMSCSSGEDAELQENSKNLGGFKSGPQETAIRTRHRSMRSLVDQRTCWSDQDDGLV